MSQDIQIGRTFLEVQPLSRYNREIRALARAAAMFSAIHFAKRFASELSLGKSYPMTNFGEPLPERREGAGERLDRYWNELLQELRVVQTGIQLLGGFLLIIPFQREFSALSDGLRIVYLISVAAATLAVFLIMAPVVMHRMLFQTHRKDVLVRMSDKFAQAGLVLLAITVTGVTALTFGVVVGEPAGMIAGTIAAVTCVARWWGFGMWALRRPASDSYE